MILFLDHIMEGSAVDCSKLMLEIRDDGFVRERRNEPVDKDDESALDLTWLALFT